MVMSKTDVCGLKGTQCAHQKLIKKLYHELDAEREASTTAVNEALSTISRLQREKGALKMEADQYKRFFEESLAMADDIIYHKEMEVAALDCQVQAYRYKLLSMGYDDPILDGTDFHDNTLQRNEYLLAGDSPSSSNIHDVYEVPQVENGTDFRGSVSLQSKVLLESDDREKNLHELNIYEPKIGLDRFDGKSEIVEVKGVVEFGNREEEVRLLNEIKLEISLLHDEIMSRRIVRKSSPRDDSSLCDLREAMLYFWL